MMTIFTSMAQPFEQSKPVIIHEDITDKYVRMVEFSDRTSGSS